MITPKTNSSEIRPIAYNLMETSPILKIKGGCHINVKLSISKTLKIQAKMLWFVAVAELRTSIWVL